MEEYNNNENFNSNNYNNENAGGNAGNYNSDTSSGYGDPAMSGSNGYNTGGTNYSYGNVRGNYSMPSADYPPAPRRKKKKPSFAKGLISGIAIGIAICILGVFVLSYLAAVNSSSNLDYSAKVELIKQYIEQYYIGDVDEEALEEGSLSGILEALGDDYAEYYTAEEMESLVASNSGEYSGIGISVFWNDEEQVEVYKVFEDTPAQEAGLQVGDLIIGANGETEFENLDSLVSIVKGESGTSVELTILRDNEELSFTVERRQITIQTIEYEMLDNNMGYIYISEFDTVTAEQFNEAIDDLLDQGMESLILDLRDNPGGQLDTVVSMADRLLPEGVILTMEDKNGNVRSETSDEENQLDIPMAAIINGNSASASEVFVGALKDYEKAVVVGETSFGKGIVQSLWQLSDGSGIKFTTEVYYTPNGTSLNGVGITPDVEVSLPEDAYDDGELTEDEDTQLQAAIEALEEQMNN